MTSPKMRVGKAAQAWKSPEVADYIKAIETDPSLLLNANRSWPMGYWAGTRKPA